MSVAIQSVLFAAMSNPYIWLVGLTLTAIGAANGVVRIYRFVKSCGSDFFRWMIRRSVKETIVSTVEHLANSPVASDAVISYYTSRLSDMLLKLTAFMFNLVVALHLLDSGLEPVSTDPSWRLISVPFLIFCFVNLAELWIVRFRLYIFQQALPLVREKLEELP